MNRTQYFKRLQTIKDENDFESLAIKVFRFQTKHNKTYHRFVTGLGSTSEKVQSLADIPFLPVEVFKSSIVLTGDESFEQVFASSGTAGDVSKHYIKDLFFYEQISTRIFSEFYGKFSDFVWLALLPSYLERQDSSLIYMIDKFISRSGHPESGFYLDGHEKLFNSLCSLKQQGQKTILFGVTFALLDFIESHKMDFPELIVMETGGMKGRREEIIREEVHERLCRGFGVKVIHSEYGMTELLSQCYSKGQGIFQSPSWMKIMIRDTYDPFKFVTNNTSGGINIIDLANIDSCCFLATQDLGKRYDDNSFEVLGRFDNSDVRGCSLMV